jgi:hypothetical protein
LKAQDIADNNWRKVLLSDYNYQFKFLAIQILLSRLKQKIKADSSPVQMASCINEIKSFFIKYESLPPVREDLQRILEEL